MRYAQLPAAISPPSQARINDLEASPQVLYDTFSNSSIPPASGSNQSWGSICRRLEDFLRNRPTMEQLLKFGKHGLIEVDHLREYQADAARSLPPGDKGNPMHKLLAGMKEEERAAAIHDLLLRRAASIEEEKPLVNKR